MGGHSDLTGGVVSGSRERMQAVFRWMQVAGGCMDPHAASLLLPLLHDPQPKVRRRALSALGSLAHKKLWKHPDKTLTPLLDDADGQVALLSAVTLWAERAATEQPQDAKHE
jgi:HEAT repeat protein